MTRSILLKSFGDDESTLMFETLNDEQTQVTNAVSYWLARFSPLKAAPRRKRWQLKLVRQFISINRSYQMSINDERWRYSARGAGNLGVIDVPPSLLSLGNSALESRCNRSPFWLHYKQTNYISLYVYIYSYTRN